MAYEALPILSLGVALQIILQLSNAGAKGMLSRQGHGYQTTTWQSPVY